ncbi:arylesterase [Shewanella pealeana]|uniref:Lipolytic protein G-D-S-L family n=1 Tax=Shewanella pealeana (strain ATCC 700345 / ANG-SQ1) TaxID=398579 RepID=A8H7I4_SHEPA|nr:arylesterase [Shewanella pealeana]ABV88521.1 lipolytic protein G-D-S-L family [Shewanella pealeana ATCC 700345]
MKHLSILRPFGRSLIILSLLLLQACSGASIPVLSENARVLAFGDSLTYGVGASKGQDYPSQLAGISGFEVINAGVSGETTSGGKKRLAQLLAHHDPELLILLEGGNDFLRNQPLATTKANLAQMIEIAQAKQIPVLLVAVPQKSLFLSPSPIYAELAEQYELVLVEDTLSSLLRTPSKKSDAIHLNDEGYTALAEAIYQAI